MGLRESFKRFFGQMGDVHELARGDRVAGLVPDDASYVTVGPVAVLPDARAFNGGDAGRAGYGRDLGYLPEGQGLQQHVALLVLAGRRLRVIEAAGERWSVDANQVTDLDGHRRGGFIVFTRQMAGLAVG